MADLYPRSWLPEYRRRDAPPEEDDTSPLEGLTSGLGWTTSTPDRDAPKYPANWIR